jgi:hypothetical protein
MQLAQNETLEAPSFAKSAPLFGLLDAAAPQSLFLPNPTLLFIRRKVNNQDVHQT